MGETPYLDGKIKQPHTGSINEETLIMVALCSQNPQVYGCITDNYIFNS